MPGHKRAKKAGSGTGPGRLLSRERIVRAAIEILNERGEEGLTFRVLAERLATGAGAMYWHVANRGDLLAAACDTVVAGMLEASAASLPPGVPPRERIRLLALATFDAMDAHPWVGAALTQAPGQLPLIRLVEALGTEIRAMGVAEAKHWVTASALLSYMLGVGGRNAANGQYARTHGLDRADFLRAMAARWSGLDAEQYPFTRSLATCLRDHDDREDFLAGVELILRGIESAGRG